MRKLGRYLIISATGGALYTAIEFAWRGHSHWTMTVLGGLCFDAMYAITDKAPSSPLILKCAAGASFITASEYAAGCIVNLLLGWEVWDYSDLRFNVLGQISLLFSVMWFFLCIPGFGLCRIFQKIFGFLDKSSAE